MAKAKRSTKLKANTPERIEQRRRGRIATAAIAVGLPSIQHEGERSTGLVTIAVPQLKNEPTPIKETVRKLTRVEMLARSGVLEAHEAAACEWYAEVHAMAFDTTGCTANYEGASGGGFGADNLLARYKAQANARDDYRMACEHVPAAYRGIFEAVVLRNETIGSVAACSFETKRSQGETKVRAAVKMCANLLYGAIAPLLNLPEMAMPATPRPARAPAAEEIAAKAPPAPLLPAIRDGLERARAYGGRPTHLVIAPMMLIALLKELDARGIPQHGLQSILGLEIEERPHWNWGWMLAAGAES